MLWDKLQSFDKEIAAFASLPTGQAKCVWPNLICSSFTFPPFRQQGFSSSSCLSEGTEYGIHTHTNTLTYAHKACMIIIHRESPAPNKDTTAQFPLTELKQLKTLFGNIVEFLNFTESTLHIFCCQHFYFSCESQEDKGCKITTYHKCPYFTTKVLSV